MKVFKKIAMVAATTLAATLLVGCGQKTNPKEITFWNPLTGDDGAYMNNIVKEYNKTKPEYPVKAVVTSDMYTKIYTAMNSKKGIPDLTLIHADRVPAFADAGMLKPMTGILKQQKNIKSENYLPQAWNAGQFDGKQYTVPLDIHANAMYYNKDLLKKYSCENFLDDNVVTFDEMMSLAGKMKKGDYVLNNSLISWVILGEIANQDGTIEKDGKPNLDTPEMRKTFESLKNLASAGLMTPNGEDGYLMFQSGNVLFSTDGTWTSTAHDAVKGLNYGVTNVYSFSPDKFTNRASSHMFALLKSSERTKGKEKGIGKFLEYVRKNSIEWAKAGQIVASKDVVESDDFKNYKQSFFTSSPEEINSLHIYDYKYYSYVDEAVNTYAMDIIYGKKDIDKGLKAIQKFAEDKIAENEKNPQE